MRRLIQLSMAAIIISAIIPLSVFAQGTQPGPTDRSRNLIKWVEGGAGLTEEPLTPEQVLANLVQIALGLVGLILIVLIIYGGWLWGSARGNEERVTQAQNLIRNAVIGVIIIFSAYFITAFVVGKIGEAVFEPLFPF